MSYEINEVVIIDGSRNIVNAGIITATNADLTTLKVNGASIGDILDEDNLGSDSASAVPTQQSVKAYVDAAVTTLQADIDQNEADSDTADANHNGRLLALEADPTTQTLLDAEAVTRGNADNALDVRVLSLEADPTTQTLLDAETTARTNADTALSNRLNTLEADPTTATDLSNAVSTLNSTISTLQADVDGNEADSDSVDADFALLSGVSLGSTTLGTFTGSTISDNISVKAALQDLETGVDNALGGGAAAASLEVESTSANAAHYLTFVTDDNVTGTQENFYTDAGVQYNPSTNILTVGEVVITGDLTVNGSQTVIDTTSITTQDKNITLGVTTSPTDATADGGGFTLKGTTDKTFLWLNSTNALTSSEHIDLATGKSYFVDNANVLSKTTLGASVVNSSLTSVGTLTNLTVTGAVDLNNNLDVDGFTELDGLNVDGATTLDGVTMSGALDLNNSLDVDGFTELDGLNVDGATTMDALTVAGDLNHGGGNIIGDGSTNISGVSSVTASGKMFAQAFTISSDERLKENITEIPEAVAKVEALRGVTFDWKSGDGPSAGVIAQDVEKVLPMLVEGDASKTVDYHGLIGLLVAAVKELSAEVKELKAK